MPSWLPLIHEDRSVVNPLATDLLGVALVKNNMVGVHEEALVVRTDLCSVLGLRARIALVGVRTTCAQGCKCGSCKRFEHLFFVYAVGEFVALLLSQKLDDELFAGLRE